MPRLILILLCITLIIVPLGSQVPIGRDALVTDQKKDKEDAPVVIQKLAQTNNEKHETQTGEKSEAKPKTVEQDVNSTSNGNIELNYHKKMNHNLTELDSSTMKRLVLVLVALSVMFILYLAFKTYGKRNRKTMVSKYGVRTRRSDAEMRPLPLDEDEEDETVFDVGTVNR